VPRGFDGHYRLTLDINGTPVSFIVDTGASQVVLSQGDAARIGLDPAGLFYSRSANTANGVVRTAPILLDQVAIEGIMDRRVPAVVNGGEMDTSLLGMTYLGLYDRIEITNGELVLMR
jgi:aspartyl protease family protein